MKRLKKGLLRRHSSQDVSKYGLSGDALKSLVDFWESAERLDHAESQSFRRTVFSEIIQSFTPLVMELKPSQMKKKKIHAVVDQFVGYCAKYGAMVLDDSLLSTGMFKSLQAVYELMGKTLPSSEKFMSFFTEVVQRTKNDPSVFAPTYPFLEILFRSREFFEEFKKQEGFTLVFLSFFLSDHVKLSSLMINLLFNVPPAAFFDGGPAEATLTICEQSLGTNDASWIALFLANYISCWSDQEVITRFRNEGSFLKLNEFMLKNCNNTQIVTCYTTMITKSGMNEVIVFSLYELYVKDECTPDMKVGLLMIFKQNETKEVLMKLHKTVPLTEWMLSPSKFSLKAYETIATLLQDAVVMGVISAEDCIDCFFSIIKPSNTEENKPVEFLFGVLDLFIQEKRLTLMQLVRHDFINIFVVGINDAQFLEYLRVPFTQKVLNNIFSEENVDNNILYGIVQRVASVYSPELHDLLTGMLRQHMPLLVFQTLLEFLRKDEALVEVILDSITEQESSFSLFVESSGFEVLDSILAQDNSELALRLLTALVAYGPKEEVEKWVLALSPDSPLFKADPALLAKASHNIGALIRWNKDKQHSLMLLDHAARYGIPLCRSFGMHLCDIPYIYEIANVNCIRTMVKQCLEDLEHLHLCINRKCFPQRPVVEMRGDGKLAYLELLSPVPITSLSFAVFCKRETNVRVLTMGSVYFLIEECHLVAKFMGKTQKTALREGWNTCDIWFQNGLMNFRIRGSSLVEIPTPLQEMNVVVFGSKRAPLETQLLLDSHSILLNSGQNYKSTTGGSVGKVAFRGFATYFPSVWSIETVFAVLEKTTDLDKFTSVFLGLINLHIVNEYSDVSFWKRLLMAIKQRADLAEQKLLCLLHEIPSSTYSANRRQNFMETVLQDLELYFSFSPGIICSLIKLIAQDLDPESIDPTIVLNLLHICQSGVDATIVIAVTDILQKIVAKGIDKSVVPKLVNHIISIKQQGITDELDVKLSKIAEDAVTKANALSLEELARIAMRYKGPTRLDWLRVLCRISATDAHFVKSIPELKYAFGQCAMDEEGWKIALAILSGVEVGPAIVKQAVISRPAFTGVILEMLVVLLRNNAKQALNGQRPAKLELQRQILIRLGLLPASSCAILLRPEFRGYLYKVLNFGMVPESMTSHAGEMNRIENKWKWQIPPVQLSDSELQQGGLENISEIKNEMDPIPYDDFPFDVENANWFDVLFVDDMVVFLSNMLMAADSNDFEKTFLELVCGNSLMYVTYQKAVTSKLAICVTKELTQNDNHNKNPIRTLDQCARMSTFANDYLSLLALVLAYASRHFSESMVREFRDILLLAFHFVDSSRHADVVSAMWQFKDIVFCSAVLNDMSFCHLLRYQFEKMKETEIMTKCLMNFYGNAKAEFFDKYEQQASSVKWNELIESLPTEITAQNRDLYARKIISETIDDIQLLSKAVLMTKIYDGVNAERCSKEQVNFLNRWMREHEDFYFQAKQVARSLRLTPQDVKSYHVSPLCLPINGPRVLNWSPFEVKDPPFERTVSLDDFKLPYTKVQSKITQFEKHGVLLSSPEWLYFHTEDGESPLNYSLVLQNDKLLEDFGSVFGDFESVYPVMLGNYVHPIPSVLFVYKKKLMLLVLATYKNGSLSLVIDPEHPITFLPFSESVTMNEWQKVSLFCGHIVLSFELNRLLWRRRHLYVHKRRGLLLSFMFDPTILLIFDDIDTCDNVYATLEAENLECRKELSSYKHLFMYGQITQAFKKWAKREMSNYDYLLLLNSFGSRSFADITQFPVFPWVQSPSQQQRDLSLPMGQLDKQRAEHFDSMYEEVNYFYGCHYMPPGAVFWYLLRICPYTFYALDLNNGWDNEQRMFRSIEAAWDYASSKNETDVKEQVPLLFTLPELYMNANKLRLKEVTLPAWSDGSPYCYTAMMRKALEETESIHLWIDLIFGYKQTGPEAIKAKNVFLPTSYHDSSPESLDMDELAFESQVTDFGQCPLQLFKTNHHVRWQRNKSSDVRMLEPNMKIQKAQVRDPWGISQGRIASNGLLIPAKACSIAPDNDFYIMVDSGKITIAKIGQKKTVLSKPHVIFSPTNATAINVSHDGMIFACSFENGKISVFQITYQDSKPTDLRVIYQFSTYEDAACSAVSICNEDFLLACALGAKIVVFNYATRLVHRVIQLDDCPVDLSYDPFDGGLVVVYKNKIEEYSVNGVKLHELTVDTEITCFCIVGYDNSFDSRIVVTGNKMGSVSFYIVIESFQLKHLLSQSMFKAPVESIFFDTSNEKLWVAAGSEANVIDLGIIKSQALIECCEFCDRPITGTCPTCGAAICSSCTKNSGLCEKCQRLEVLARPPS